MGYSCHLGSAVRIKLLDADGQPIHAGRMPAAGSMGDYQSRCGEDEPLQQLRVKDRLVIAYRHARHQQWLEPVECSPLRPASCGRRAASRGRRIGRRIACGTYGVRGLDGHGTHRLRVTKLIGVEPAERVSSCFGAYAPKTFL